jgi:hypothetical protein
MAAGKLRCESGKWPLVPVERPVGRLTNDKEEHMFIGTWTKCTDNLPQNFDDSIIVYFAETGSIETVNCNEYFSPITDGLDEHGNQKWTYWYLCQNVTHWMFCPDPPDA